MDANSKWVCIDFGTCNTAAAIEIDGAPHVVTYGNHQFFPTIACVLDDGSIEVCQNAEPLRRVFPESFKQEFKLQIGDELDINNVDYTDIVSRILGFIKGCAEIENNNEEIENALLTVPALYTQNDRRKSVMESAARKAGFVNVEFMSEPEAAAFHYAYVSGLAKTGISLVYDLGGGTFDPVLLDMSSDTPKLLGYNSGVKAGGHFFDKAIYDHIAALAKARDEHLERVSRLEDYACCRRLKESLSIKDSALQVFSNGKTYRLERRVFESLVRPTVGLTLQACDNLLDTANLRWSDISQVLFVGGSTAIPLIGETIKNHLVSHNATNVRIVRTAKGPKGEYSHRFATCLGGIAKKILPPPPPPEKVAVIVVDGKNFQLKVGDNSFGRDPSSDFTFADPALSRHHFTISVSKAPGGGYSYQLTTKSTTQATIVNGSEPLDLRYVPITRISADLHDGFTINAGKTVFRLEKQSGC